MARPTTEIQNSFGKLSSIRLLIDRLKSWIKMGTEAQGEENDSTFPEISFSWTNNYISGSQSSSSPMISITYCIEL